MSLTRLIPAETQTLLKRIYRQSRHRRVSQRAHCLWLKSQGMKNTELQVIFPVSEKTLYNWFNAWNDQGLLGVYKHPDRGRKPKLTEEQTVQVKAWVEASPRNLKGVLEKIKTTWDITISRDTLKRILKAVKLSWRRMRQAPAKTASAAEYDRKSSALESLKALDVLDIIDVLGFMSHQGRLESYVSEQSITSDVVAACIEVFFPKVEKPTVLIMD